MRFFTRRSIIVNFKGFPFHPRDSIEWHRRVQDMTHAGIRPVNFEGETGFEQKTLAELRELALKYGASHIVVESSFAAARDRSAKPLHQDKRFAVYKTSDIPAAAATSADLWLCRRIANCWR